jgi:3-hydroxyacyl-CoA dehydrogenase
MPLIEIVRGELTEDSAVATTYALAVRMGKVPVVVRDGPGFLVNRILGPYLNEAGHLFGEGATIDAIDEAAISFGMPMGPLRLIDEVGIDIVRHAGETLHNAFGERLAPAPALVAIGDSGRLGKKGGNGFYKYKSGHESGADPMAYDLLRSGDVSPELRPTPDVIRDRLVLSMINEGARVLSDGIASSAADLDLAMIMGTGFPPFRGGLLKFADEIHPRALLLRLEHYESTLGERFSPAPLLRQLSHADRGFYEAFPRHTHLLPPASRPHGSLHPTADPR